MEFEARGVLPSPWTKMSGGPGVGAEGDHGRATRELDRSPGLREANCWALLRKGTRMLPGRL